MLTKEERKALAALRRLEGIWPNTLVLVHHCDSTTLKIKKPSDHPGVADDDLASVPALAHVRIRIETVT